MEGADAAMEGADAAMEGAGGVPDLLVGDGNPEVPTVPTTVSWPFIANDVRVSIWSNGDWTWIPLVQNGQVHSIVLPLKPSIHWLFYCVDGVNCHNPYLSWESRRNGQEKFKVNFLSVKDPQSKPDNEYEFREGCPITYKHPRNWLLGQLETVDHIKLLWLYPGSYQMMFLVDGQTYTDPSTSRGQDSNGVFFNTVTVNDERQSHELHGCTSAALLDDFLVMQGNELSVVVKFTVGSQCGSIPPEAKACPCTLVGYMLLNGYISCLKEEYTRGCSWAGCFKPSDMVVVDNKHCQIKRRAAKPLTRTNFLLDVHQLKDCLFLKYQKGSLLPPYFSSFFTFIENPPEDFDSNMVSRDRFLDFFDNQAALALPPQRMLSLVNMGQFFKQLPEPLKSKFALKFNPILKESSTWQTTTFKDTLLKSVFTARRKLKPNGDLVTPVPNTSLEATYSLRVFFIHGPEHTFDNKQTQILKDFAEFDLVIAHHFDRLLADFLKCVHENMNEHVLIKAMWNFYCGGAPPDHHQLEQYIAPAVPPA